MTTSNNPTPYHENMNSSPETQQQQAKPVTPEFAEEVVNSVKSDFAARQKMRRPYELNWQLNMNFVMGNQYCAVSPRGSIEQEDKYYFWQEKQVFNHIATIVETRMSRLNRVRPRPMARPFSGSDADVNSAKLATKILSSAREKMHLDEIITRATAWSEVCGTSFYKVSWDAACDEATVSVCSPFEIYPDSNVTASVEDCTSVIHAKVYSASEVKDTWGVDIAGDTVKVFAIDGAASVGGLGYNTVVPSIVQETKNDQVLVIERYTKPTSAHPHGKLEIVAGNELLYYGELPYMLGENGEYAYPFIRQVSLDQAGCFWGTSMVERVIPIQRAYNAVKNRKHEFLNRLAMGVLTVEDGSVDTDNLEEEGLSPGKILVYRQGAVKPQLMDSGDVPSDFAKEEEHLLSEFNDISGVSEFARKSSTPTTVTSGVALQLIAEQDDIRLAGSVDSIKRCIKRISQYILRLYKQFVSNAKLMRYADGQNSAELFYFTSSDIGSDDVVFETENELTDSPATRRSMLFDLLNAGILTDSEGRLSQSTKAKVLSMMGFGNWDSAQDIAQMHIARAQRENVDIDHAEVLPVDDHALHIEEHTRHIIAADIDDVDVEYRAKILAHIAKHKESALIDCASIKNKQGESNY
ncbi:MAG: hypothetical protein J1G02_00515 [Clostridiales bacterium]|nr:hypothetical protein [Clostridiales bacterium]